MRFAFFVLALFFTAAVQGESFPAKPVRILVGFPAGGVTDVLARPIAQRLSQRYGVQFLVDNRPGATGQIANELVVKAPADGYTLLAAPGSSIASYPHMRAKMPYDSLRDLAPVIEIARFSYVLVRHPGVPARNIGELIALARRRPGLLTFASPGIGTAFHLSGELLKNMAGIDMVHVPYKGGTAALTDMLAGRIDLLFYSLAVVQPLIESKRLAAIAVTGRTRMAQLPDVPTIDESGVKGFEMIGWQGMFAPAKTPAAILRQVGADVAGTFADNGMKALWTGQGMEFVPNTVPEFASLVRRDYERYGRLVTLAGIPRE